MRRPHLSRLALGPGGLIGVALVLATLASGGALVIGSEIASREGERSSFFVENGDGERFDQVVRVRSDDNAGTSVAFSRLAYPKDGNARTVVIGRDDVFADNLAAGLLQAKGPLLLTDSRVLNATVRDEIRRLGAATAYVVGGPKAVSPAIEEDLRGLGLRVTRLSGATRVETALAIATHVAPATGKALLVRARDAAGGDSSQAWADSLAAGAFAAASGIPVLLTDSAALHPDVAAWLKGHAIRDVYAIGGQAAIAPGVLDQVEAAGMRGTRVAGAERAETAVRVAERLWGFRGSQTADQVVLVDGFDPNSWAAGVSAAAFSARFRAPIVLANGQDIPPATDRWIERGGGTLVCGSSVRDDACDEAAAPPQEPGRPGPAPGGSGSPSPSPSASPSPAPSPTATFEPLVRLTDSRRGVAMFDLEDLYPGDTATRRTTVQNAGQVGLVVRLHGRVSGALAGALRLRIVANPDAGGGKVLFDDRMDRFGTGHSSYHAGLDNHRLAGGEERVYEFTVTVPQHSGYGGSEGARATFVWEGRG